jgi:nucleoside-diphosphate-sugar epimerase
MADGKPLNVLVTGGCGFIGSHLVEDLIAQGCSVVILDNFSSGKKENFKRFIGSNRLRIIEGDVRKGKIVNEASRDMDAVVHLAALVDVAKSVRNPIETHDVNVTGTLNVLEAAAKQRVQKFVFASSAAVYGEGNPLPLREEFDLRPVSPYAASKVSGEYYCKMYCDCYGLSGLVLRFFNVYGPGQGSNDYAGVITRFVQSGVQGEPLTIYGDGNQTRDFINVKDVVVSIEKALTFKSSKTDVINICTGEPITVNEIALSLCGILGKNLQLLHVQPRAGDILHNYGDPDKAQRVLGFKAQVRFENGLRLLVKSLP